MQKIKSLWILFWKKCSFLHHHRKVLLKLSKCILLNASGICKFYTCKKSPFWKQSSNVRHFCPTGSMDPIFHIWAVVTYTKAWGKYQGDKWLFTFCQTNEPKMMLGLSSIMVCLSQHHPAFCHPSDGTQRVAQNAHRALNSITAHCDTSVVLRRKQIFSVHCGLHKQELAVTQGCCHKVSMEE